MPKGGPDGGDGGRGGDVVLRCDDSLRDLQSFRRRAHFRRRARRPRRRARSATAPTASALIVAVPPGTQVERWDGTRYDLVAPGPGGRRSRAAARAGAATSASRPPTRQAPRLAERGLPGEEGAIELQLKLLADVGLVGLPNAGKSSLLARLTRAQPKVADYPFTTLEPVLGTLDADDRQLVLADIPGLIEGASDGAGLGHDFLAHVERTRLLVHVLDLAPLDGSDPVANHAVIERELAEHDPRLAALPRILALSKADLVPPEAADGGRGASGASGSATTSRCSSPRARPARASTSCARELLRRVPVAEPAPRGGRRRGRASPSTASSARRRGRAFDVERVGRRRVPRHRRARSSA